MNFRHVAGHRVDVAAIAGDPGRRGRLAVAVHGDAGAAPRELGGDGRSDASVSCR
jgi:hypothetical protein